MLSEPTPSLAPAPAGPAPRSSGWSLALVVGFLVALRVTVFSSEGVGFSVRELLGGWREDPASAFGVVQLFVSSLCFELLALLGLCALVRGPPPARWLARAALLVLLWLDFAGTYTFIVLNTYVKGFQLVGLSPRELGRMLSGFAGPAALAGLAVPVGLALLFGREGSLERRRPSRRTALLLGGLALAAILVVASLLRRPLAVPTVAHSPFTLLLVRFLPEGLAHDLPQGRPAPMDWAPAPALAAHWQALAQARREFNIVVVVLESVRADVFWPSSGAPPMPRLAALGPHAALFSRAYAHEPLTTKGLEALLFGTYPAPYWETSGGRWPDIALDSVGERWTQLGLRTAFIGWGEIPFLGEEDFLARRGFGHYVDTRHLAQLEAQPSDRTQVVALARFIDQAPQQRFAAVLWPHTPHLPYQLPAPLKNRHPLNSPEAYREAVAYLDLVIGDLADMLQRRGLAESTVVVLVADHGESFGEHPEGGLAHGDRLFETSVHIPLVFINPRLFHGERDERVVQQKDVAATLAWLAGDERPHLNAASTVFHQRTTEAAYLVSHMDVASLRGALVLGRLKYLYTGPVGSRPADERLYDVVADPGETRNLWSERLAEGQALRARYFGWLRYWQERWAEVERSGRQRDRKALEALLFKPQGGTAVPPAGTQLGKSE